MQLEDALFSSLVPCHHIIMHLHYIVLTSKIWPKSDIVPVQQTGNSLCHIIKSAGSGDHRVLGAAQSLAVAHAATDTVR